MVTPRPLLGAGSRPMTGTAVLSRRESRRSEETTGGRAGAEKRLTDGDILVLSMANCLTANTTVPNWPSRLSGLPRTTAVPPTTPHPPPQQLDVMTLVSREMCVRCVQLQTSLCATHVHTFTSPHKCARPCSHSGHETLRDKEKSLIYQVVYAVLW